MVTFVRRCFRDVRVDIDFKSSSETGEKMVIKIAENSSREED